MSRFAVLVGRVFNAYVYNRLASPVATERILALFDDFLRNDHEDLSVVFKDELYRRVIEAYEGGRIYDQEILQVLKDRGIVDEDEYQRLAAKNAKYEAERNSWMPEIDWSGDFRFRHESWWYEKDETGAERSDRYRVRYRFRLKGVVNINDYADVVFRLVSGGQDNRSNNKTLGSRVDFDTDVFQMKGMGTLPISSTAFPSGNGSQLSGALILA